jgi:hypothetical protein
LMRRAFVKGFLSRIIIGTRLITCAGSAYFQA